MAEPLEAETSQSTEGDSVAILPLLTRGLLTWPPRRFSSPTVSEGGKL